VWEWSRWGSAWAWVAWCSAAARRSAELVQRQLEQQNEKLRKLDEAKTQFIATVSHELRTPLTSIVSFSELLKAETQSLSPDGTQFLAIDR
jgi:signal transduction histidine kinase